MSATFRTLRAAARGADVPWRLLMAATVFSAAFTWWLYVVGDQPIIYDSRGYLRRAVIVAEVGVLNYAHGDGGQRTYGYPWFVSLVVPVVGTDPLTVRAAVALIQWGLFVPALAVSCWAVARELRSPSLAASMYVAGILNPVLLITAGMILTDFLSAVVVWCAAVFAIVGGGRLTRLLPTLSFGIAAFSTMVRPANLAVVIALAAVWGARYLIRRDVSLFSLAIGAFVGVAVFIPQVVANQRAYEIAHPLMATDNLYERQTSNGVQRLKYATVVIDGFDPQLRYLNPFNPEGGYQLDEYAWADPGGLMLTLALHGFTFVDQDFPFPYIRNLNPWYRFPLGVVNFSFLLVALWGLVTGLRARRTPPFPLLALLVILGAYVAVYLPTTIENRYSMPVYLLVLPGFALGLKDMQIRWSARSRTLLPGVVILAGLVAGGLALSEWVRMQAPVLRALSST